MKSTPSLLYLLELIFRLSKNLIYGSFQEGKKRKQVQKKKVGLLHSDFWLSAYKKLQIYIFFLKLTLTFSGPTKANRLVGTDKNAFINLGPVFPNIDRLYFPYYGYAYFNLVPSQVYFHIITSWNLFNNNPHSLFPKDALMFL